MKTFWKLLVLLIYANPFLFAQDLVSEFGQIRLTDFDYQYELEPEADAIVLFDIGETTFIKTSTGGLDIEFKRTRRIKINNKEGLAYANIAIPYYVDGRGRTELVKDIKATAYYITNGALQTKKLDKKDVFSEKVNKYWRQQKFAIPNVVEGAIIEYQYTLETPFHVNLPDWEFQSDIPTVYSRYIAKVTPFYNYVSLLQGERKSYKQTSIEERGSPRYFAGVPFNDMVHTFEMKNIPSFKDESYISSKKDYIIKLDFQLAHIHSPQGGRQEFLTTYPKLIRELNDSDYFGKYLKKAKKVAKNLLANEISGDGASQLDRSKIIIDYVKQNYNWDGIPSMYARKTPKEVVQQKTGNSSEINLLLVALLKEAGIQVSPVLLSTRNHGKINKNYPFSHEFNYVLPLIEIDSDIFLTDGTAQYIPYDRIPIRCMNDVGLRMKEENPTWVSLSPYIASKVNHRINISPNLETAMLDVGIKSQLTEVQGYLQRERYQDDAEKMQVAYAELNLENITAFKTANYEKLAEPYKIEFKANYPMEGFHDKLLIRPFLNYPPTENNLKQPNRTYPVDLVFKQGYNYGSYIDIPNGYAAKDLPEEYRINNDLVRLYYNVSQKEQQLIVTASVTYKKEIYPPADYEQLKQFFDTIVEKLNEPIVLEK